MNNISLLWWYLHVNHSPHQQASAQERHKPSELTCRICGNLMEDAALVPCCGKSFCKECTYTFSRNLCSFLFFLERARLFFALASIPVCIICTIIQHQSHGGQEMSYPKHAMWLAKPHLPFDGISDINQLWVIVAKFAVTKEQDKKKGGKRGKKEKEEKEIFGDYADFWIVSSCNNGCSGENASD